MPTQFPPKGDADKKIGAYEAPISVTQQDVPSMSVRIRAGSFFNGANQFVEYPGGVSPALTAPVGNPAWALVSLSNAGTVAVTYGAPAPIPSLPALNEGMLPLAAVYLTPATTAITQQHIIDVRPFLRTIDVVPNLPTELANRPTVTDVGNMLAAKADTTGTPATSFTLNSLQTTGTLSSNVELNVQRGTLPTVSLRWNETTTLWELTNDGTSFYPIATAAGTYAPVVHTHVAADVTDFSTAVDALIALSTISQSQVTGLVADLNSKADLNDFTDHVLDASIHFELPIAQSDVVGLPAAIAAKANLAGDVFTGSVTVQPPGGQPISLTSFDGASSGLFVDRPSGPDARFEWDESAESWLVGTTGSMGTIVTGSALDTKADKVTQIIAGTGLSGGGSLNANVTIGLPTVATPVANELVKITTDAQGRVTSTSAVLGTELPAHEHVAADVTDFDAAASAAAPVQTVAGRTGDVVITSADLADFGTAASAAAPVQTVAGRTGDVVLSSADVTDFTSAVTAIGDPRYVNVTGDAMTGNLAMSGNRVTGLAAAGAPGEAVRYDEFTTHTHVPANIIGFSAAVAAAAPVQSVNGETGVVSLSPSDVGAAPAVHTHVAADITNFATAADARIAAAVGVTVQGYDATTLKSAAIGTSVQAFDAGLTSLSNVGANGFVTRTANDSFTARTIAGTSGRVTVANGDGVASNPTVDVVESGINHNALANVSANQHVDHSTVSITAGRGMTGGGNITATRTLGVAAFRGSASLTYPAIDQHTSADATITVTGAQIGDPVALSLTAPVPPFVYMAFVSAPNTVTVRCTAPNTATAGQANVTAAAIVFTYSAFA